MYDSDLTLMLKITCHILTRWILFFFRLFFGNSVADREVVGDPGREGGGGLRRSRKRSPEEVLAAGGRRREPVSVIW